MLDYFAAKPGKDGTKTDWAATLRNWERRSIESSSGRRGAPVQRSAGYQPIEERKRAEYLAEAKAKQANLPRDAEGNVF